MGNRIDERFIALAAQEKSAFIPYITAGDPTLAQTESVLHALEQAGSDIIELGVPFSDPIGDGPIIQEAAQRALKHNVSLRDVLAMIKRVREKSEVPILIFTYFNPLLAYGIEDFARDAATAGADGVLCVDLPPDEADEYRAALDENNMRTVFLLAPTTTEERIAVVAKQSSGFVYYVSRLGVTGVQSELQADLNTAVEKVRRHTDKPVVVGFAVSKQEHAIAVDSYADGVVVGSAIVRLIGDLGDVPELAEKVGAFAQSLSEAAKA
jgi:tryptophan synthase alpha chain